jgi:hypothetical protein
MLKGLNLVPFRTATTLDVLRLGCPDFYAGGIFDTTSTIEITDPPGSDGTIILTFESCNSGTIEYDIPSINRQGLIPIWRVANDNIVICEALRAD